MTTEKKDLVHLDKPLAEGAAAPGECGSVPDERTKFDLWYGKDSHFFVSSLNVAAQDLRQARWEAWQARAALGMQPPNNQPNSDHVAVIGAKPDSVHLAVTSAEPESRVEPALKRYDTSGNESEHGCFVLYTEHVKAVQDAYAHAVNAYIALAKTESGISSLDRRPNEKTFADKTGTFADTSNCFIQTEQPSLSDARIDEIANSIVTDDPVTWWRRLAREIEGIAAQRQDTTPLSIPTETGIYAWLNEYSAAVVMVNKRPSDCSPGGVLNGHVMESAKFYDGCRVEYWTGGKWFGPLRAAIANGAPK